MSEQTDAARVGDWQVHDTERGTVRAFETRSDAESAVEEMEGLGVSVELFGPGDAPEPDSVTDTADETAVDGGTATESDAESKAAVGDTERRECDDHGTVPHTLQHSGWKCDECVAETPTDTEPEPEVVAETSSPAPVADEQPDDTLPDERHVSEDPLSWMPSHFIDEIDGTPAINRKGYEVLSHHYGVSVTVLLVVAPEDTGRESARAKAVAETEDGRVVEAYGSAHITRGDDAYLLVEMACTRAKKRALSGATGVGTVAVEELQNEVDG